MIRATGGRVRASLIAAGMMLCISAPLQANDMQANDMQAEETDTKAIGQTAEAGPGKPVVLNTFSRRKRSARLVRVKRSPVIAKGYRRKAIEADAASNVVPMTEAEAAIPDTVSNANAQWPVSATSVRSVTGPEAAPDAVASDQLSDIDRTLSAAPTGDDAASRIASKMAVQVAQNPSQAAGVNVPTTAAPAMSAMASADKPEIVGNDDSAWGQSSLIGKIFIAFGGLLTVASAARMFMA